MEIWKSLAEVAAGLGHDAQTAITVGKFDGVHLGHRALLRGATKAAKVAGFKSVCLTFDRHPDALLAPERVPIALTGESQKLEQIAQAGVDATLLLAFDEALANQTPREFVQQVLVEALNAKHIVVGDDFRFGARGSGDVRTLAELGIEFGFAVEVVPPVMVAGRRVSTSIIRELLNEGDVSTAAQMLGRLHSTRGTVEHGLKLGRQLGFPTANLSRESEGFLPLDGVYAGWLHCEGVRYPAALSVGINETIQAVPRLLEAHVLDRTDLDLYDKVVDVEYVQFLRKAAKFDGIETLIAAIGADCDQIREILRAENILR
jgi:riboflavin kinase/FMN adenylyltransferase